MHRFVRWIGVGCLCVAAAPAAAQEFDLSVRNVMRGPDLVGTAPSGLRAGFGGATFDWSPDSRFVFMRWRQPGVDTAQVIYRVDPRDGSFERFADADADTLLAGPAEWDRAGRRALFAIDGDLWLWSRGETRRLFDAAATSWRSIWRAAAFVS
jgi:hypothetical protein